MAVFLLMFASASYAQICEVDRVKEVLRKNLYLYLTSSSSPLTLSEAKDLLVFYLNIGPNLISVDCSGTGPLSGRIIYDIVNNGENAVDIIPACSDGTKYGKCGATKPKYCYGGSLINKCNSCGCPSGKSCNSVSNNCDPTGSNITCFSSLDCETSQFTGGYYCSNNSITRNYLSYTCINPGTTSSYCNATNTPTTLSFCNFLLNQTCVDGSVICQVVAPDITPPTVSITAPADGATVSGTTAVSATASDNVGVVGVQFKLDAVNLQAEDTVSPYSITWDTATATNGPHSLTAVARDAAGNPTTSAVVNVTVNNAAGPVGWWKFDGDALDSSGNGNNGILVNGPVFTIGTGALNLDGVDDYVQTTSTQLKTENSFTIALWFKARSTVFGRHLVWQGIATGGGWGAEQEMHLSLGELITSGSGTSNRLSFFLGNTDSFVTPPADVISFGVNFTDTANWNFVAVTVSDLDTSPSASMYLSGVLVGTDTGITSNTTRGLWDTALRFGRPGTATRFFNGTIDDIRIYNTALTAAEITTLYNMGDTSTPTVSISSPANGATVSGTAQIVSATASDNVGVVGVQFRLDGANLGAEDTTSPYSISWDTSTASNGAHTLTAVARDAAGNTQTSTSVSVTVSNVVTGLIANWKFDENTGTTAQDSSGNGNTGTLINSPAWVPGKVNSALFFDATSKYVEVPDANILSPTNATFIAWVLLNTTPTETYSIINKWSQTVDDEYLFGISTTSNLYLAWQTTGGGVWGTTSFNDVSSTGTIPIGQFTHAAVVRNEATISFYINGALSSSSNVIDTNPFRNGINTLRIGAQSRVVNRFFYGKIDEVSIYNRALSASEIQSLYNSST